jgi:hypothetical protein
MRKATRRMNLGLCVIICLISPSLIALGAGSSGSKAKSKIADVKLTGVLVVRHSFFDAAKEAIAKTEGFQAPKQPLTDRLLVTEDGVYSFIESPKNEGLLKDIKPGTTLHVRGKLLTASKLLWLDEVEAAKMDVPINVDTFRKAKGKNVTVIGHNRCQCHLKMGGLPHSCKLGHLHHLQTADGTFYHYIPVGVGATNLAGKRGTHGRRIKVEALLLPGNILLVTSSERKK